MLSLRTRIFIVLSLVVLFILGVSVFLFVKSKKTETNTNATPVVNNQIDSNNFNYNPTIQTPVVGGKIPEGMTIKPSTSLEVEQNAVKQYAKIFVERYNSYSTDGNFQNITEVQSLVTGDLWKVISAKMGQSSTGSFVGVTTRVFTSEIKEWKNDSAVVFLSTSITEEKNSNISNRQQNITVSLEKNDGSWLVSKFEWEK